MSADDKLKLVERLRAECSGHPHAKIAWPHRILHEAASALEASEAKIAALTAELRIAKETAVYERDRTDAAEGQVAAMIAENVTLREALLMIERLGPDWIGEIARAALRQEGKP